MRSEEEVRVKKEECVRCADKVLERLKDEKNAELRKELEALLKFIVTKGKTLTWVLGEKA